MDWVDIHKWPEYQINLSGQIRNKKRGSLKSQYIGSTGYYMVSLSRKNKSYPRRVHHLLMKAFVPNPKNKPEVNHINGIKTDNRLENLEWATHKENMSHAFRTGLINNTGVKNGMNKLTVNQVKKIKILLQEGVPQYKIAKEIGNISRSTVLKIKLGKMWNHI